MKKETKYDTIVGGCLLAFLLVLALICMNGCALVGDPIYDPETGTYIASPLSSALSTLGEGAVDIAPEALANGLTPGTITSIGGLLLAAAAAAFAAKKRRDKIVAGKKDLYKGRKQ